MSFFNNPLSPDTAALVSIGVETPAGSWESNSSHLQNDSPPQKLPTATNMATGACGLEITHPLYARILTGTLNGLVHECHACTAMTRHDSTGVLCMYRHEQT